jgi:hypothetical protein
MQIELREIEDWKRQKKKDQTQFKKKMNVNFLFVIFVLFFWEGFFFLLNKYFLIFFLIF